jgi:hypothetical protein
MLTRKWIIVLVLSTVAATYCVAILSAEEAADEQSLPSFKDRIVLLAIDDSSVLENKRGSAYLKEPVLQKVGNRYFIIGDAYMPKSEDESRTPWQMGAQVGIAWDKVQAFYVYTPERMEEIWKERSDE